MKIKKLSKNLPSKWFTQLSIW